MGVKMLRVLTWRSLTPLYSPQLPPFLRVSSCIWNSPLPRGVYLLGSKVERLETPPTTAVPHRGKKSVRVRILSLVQEHPSPWGLGFGGRRRTSRGKVKAAGASSSIAGCLLGCLRFGSRNLIRGCCQPRLPPREAETDGVLRGADKKRASCQIEGD